MKHILRLRPSPALVIACAALFVSLGGVSYGVATGFIDSREIKNNTIKSSDVRNSSIQGRDVALNTLTGADIKEPSLGKVPTAAVADNAAAVGGLKVQKFFAKATPGAPHTEVFRNDFFVLEASCSADNFPVLQIDGVAGAPPTNLTGSTLQQGGDQIFVTDDALLPGDHDGLIPAPVKGSGVATVSTTGGAVATIVYAGEDAPTFIAEHVCVIRGTVTWG